MHLKAVNKNVESPDLFYCIWFTNQIALTLSIGIGCLNLFLFSNRWLFLEKIIIIDRDLRRHFNIHIPYEIRAQISKITTFCLIFKSLIVTLFAMYFLFELLEFYLHFISASLAIYIIITSCLACTTEFSLYVRTINERHRYLNLVLQQLLFDEPIDNDKYIFIDSKYGFSMHELNCMYHSSSRLSKSTSWMNIWHTRQSLFSLQNHESIDEKRSNILKKNIKIFPNPVKSKSAAIKQLIKSYRLSDFGNFNKM